MVIPINVLAANQQLLTMMMCYPVICVDHDASREPVLD